MEEKEKLSYYLTPIKKLKDCKVGDYVYNDRAELCYVDNCDYMEGHYVLKSYGFEIGCGMDADVYPITLQTARIMEKMAKHRDKWHKARIMDGAFSNELANELHELMLLNPYEEGYCEKEADFWQRLENRFEEMRAHGRALHLCN